jgi:hypothetical protein
MNRKGMTAVPTAETPVVLKPPARPVKHIYETSMMMVEMRKRRRRPARSTRRDPIAAKIMFHTWRHALMRVWSVVEVIPMVLRMRLR